MIDFKILWVIQCTHTQTNFKYTSGSDMELLYIICTGQLISSVESQKGVIAAQRCSIENQKRAIAVQSQWQ